MLNPITKIKETLVSLKIDSFLTNSNKKHKINKHIKLTNT